MQHAGFVVMAIVLLNRSAGAQQDQIQNVVAQPGAQPPPAGSNESAEPDQTATLQSQAPEWEFSLSAYAYIIPEEQDYLQTTFTADRGWLHFEVRHQYEDLDTFSAWIGCNFSFGDELVVDFTPIIGGVFGDTDGAGVGYEANFAWRQIILYTEGEYVFDSHDSSDDFFYSSTDLTWSFCDWLRAGAALQRSKIRADEDVEYEAGPMVGVTWKALDFSAYVLFPEEGDPTVVLGIAIEF